MERRLKGKDFEIAHGQVGGLGSPLERCKGYELDYEMAPIPPLPTLQPFFYLKPKYERDDQDAWWWYRPFEEHPNLFFEFAGLEEKKRSNPARINDIALDWVNEHGLLGTSSGYYRDRETFQKYKPAEHEYVDHFFEEVERAAAVLDFYEASLNRDEDAIMDLLEQYPTWPVDLYDHYSLSDRKDLYGGNLGFALYLVTREVVRMVDAFAYPKLTLQPGSSRPSSLTSGYGFHNLLGAMYLKMYWLVAAGEKHIARCQYCRQRIILIASASDREGKRKGRKPRRDKRFCNSNCRQHHHQNKKKKL